MDIYDVLYLIDKSVTVVLKGYVVAILSCFLMEYRLDHITWFKKDK